MTSLWEGDFVPPPPIPPPVVAGWLLEVPCGVACENCMPRPERRLTEGHLAVRFGDLDYRVFVDGREAYAVLEVLIGEGSNGLVWRFVEPGWPSRPPASECPVCGESGPLVIVDHSADVRVEQT